MRNERKQFYDQLLSDGRKVIIYSLTAHDVWKAQVAYDKRPESEDEFPLFSYIFLQGLTIIGIKNLTVQDIAELPIVDYSALCDAFNQQFEKISLLSMLK